MTQGAGVGRRPVPLVALSPSLTAPPGWDATLALRYERRGPRTVMTGNLHSGPLTVQKSLYPEGGVCHTVILHPPGGIAGGDRLRVDLHADSDAHILLTTPGATKWYKANGREASQSTRVTAATGAIVEWLPLETIIFDGAIAHASLHVDLLGDARAAGWEVVAFGRRAAGECFNNGRFRQTIEVRRDSRLLWAEHGEVDGGSPLLASPAGYDGRTVSGLFWFCGAPLDDETLAVCRAADNGLPPRMLAGVTSLPGGVTLARCLCDSTAAARQYLLTVWRVLRPLYSGCVASSPRLWAT